MFKSIKFLAVCAIALFAASCNEKNPNNGGGGSTEDGLQVNVSALTIYADGKESVTFSLTYNGSPLSASDVVAYDANTDTQVTLNNLSFSTTAPGDYSFYFVYTPAESKDIQSDNITITAIAEANVEPIKGEKGLSVRTSASILMLNESVTFVVRYDGEVLPNLNGVSLRDATNNSTLTHGTKVVTGSNGTPYTLLTYTPSKTGDYSIIVDAGALYGSSNPIKIKVVNYAVPSRPADAKPASTSFKHRSLIMQFTGLNCSYCPYMREALETVLTSEAYADKAVLAAIHGTAYSPDMSFVVMHDKNIDLASILGVTSFPVVMVDWAHTYGNQGLNKNIENIEKALTYQQGTPAKAGIAANAQWKRNKLLVRASVKAGANGDYYVGAWLLENGLKGIQAGVTSASNPNIDFDTHNKVVRIADSREGTRSYIGHPVGTLSKGDVADYLFEMEIANGWAASNCHLVLFVAYSSDGKSASITNAVETKSLTSGVSFEYTE